MNNILTSIENGIMTITVNRPDKLNALNRETIQEIGAAVRSAEKDNSVRGIILTGAGEKAFVAGADISEFSSYTVAEAIDLSASGHKVFDSIENCSKPVIAAVNGFALGGGCERELRGGRLRWSGAWQYGSSADRQHSRFLRHS